MMAETYIEVNEEINFTSRLGQRQSNDTKNIQSIPSQFSLLQRRLLYTVQCPHTDWVDVVYWVGIFSHDFNLMSILQVDLRSCKEGD